MSESYSNEFSTTLAAGVAIADTTISVVSVSGAPAANFRIKINSEYMLVRSITGSGPYTLGVDRAQEGTAAIAHNSGDAVVHVLTAEGLSDAITQNAARQIYWYDEMNFRTAGQFYNHGFIQSVAGTSSGTFNAANPAGHPGVVNFGTGSTTSGRATLTATSNMFVGIGRLRYGGVFRLITALSDATNTYGVWMGWANSFGSAFPQTGIYFRYAYDVNGGRWEAACSVLGTATQIDTGITAAISAWRKFEIDINVAGNEVRFYIDNALVATITTNIPSTSTSLQPVPIAIFKSVGTTARNVELDAFWYQWDLTPTR